MGKGQQEVGFGLGYFDRQYQQDGQTLRQSNLDVSGRYLMPVKTFWTGFDLAYGSSRSTVSDSGHLSLGVPFKYWIKGPESKGIGFYVVGTPYFGRSTDAESNSFLGVSSGPGLVYFFSDLLGIDTRLYYDYRRVGSSPWVTTGLSSGFAVYF